MNTHIVIIRLLLVDSSPKMPALRVLNYVTEKVLCANMWLLSHLLGLMLPINSL